MLDEEILSKIEEKYESEYLKSILKLYIIDSSMLSKNGMIRGAMAFSGLLGEVSEDSELFEKIGKAMIKQHI